MHIICNIYIYMHIYTNIYIHGEELLAAVGLLDEDTDALESFVAKTPQLYFQREL
jgi:hypothetical protein